MAKRGESLKAKQKKQKIVAGVLGVVMLGLVAFQFPRVMKQLHKKPPVSTVAASTTPAGTPSLAAPTLSGSEQPTAASNGGSSLTSGDVPPPATDGQLASFSRFASKDPFAQQLSDDATAGGGGGGSTSSGGSSPGFGGSSGSGSSGVRSPGPGSAVISVNGTLMSVAVGTDFPQPTSGNPSAQPLFHLTSLTTRSAKISIVGGSYSNGAAAATLYVNKPLTLMNTADGTKYRLILKPQGTAVPGAAGTGGGTSTTPTVTLPPASP
jgi:eukaryotic-like serine/threonine-protein kinase